MKKSTGVLLLAGVLLIGGCGKKAPESSPAPEDSVITSDAASQAPSSSPASEISSAPAAESGTASAPESKAESAAAGVTDSTASAAESVESAAADSTAGAVESTAGNAESVPSEEPNFKISMLEEGVPFSFGSHTVAVYADADEYGDIESLTVALDGQELSTETWAYSVTPVLIERGTKATLMIQLTSDNDWRLMNFYDVGGASPSLLAEFGNMGFAVDYNDFSVIYPEDPDKILLSTRVDLMSTYSAQRYYHLDEEGMPVSDELYTIVTYGDNPLTVREAVTVKAVDAAGNETGDKVLNVGDTITLEKTDGKSFVDVKVSDGSMARIYVDTSQGWPQTVNGSDVQALFDGMRFAG